ncbi:MAG: AMIN domain-containing protein [Campylobacterales bacterium]
MVKIVILMLLFFLTLEGRENPFFFDSELKQLPYTSNLDKNLPPLKRAAITLPSTARVIEKVTVSYKTLNGSIEEKTIILGNSIDWHLPIFISQNYSASEVKKDIRVKSNTLKNPVQKVNRSSDKFIEIAKRQYIKFLALDKKLKLITKSKKIRDFLLVKPHRIVIDFKKKSDILSYVKKNPNSIFKTITIGNHEGYYRVVIELDGYYGYSIKELTNGYLISLK